MHCICLKEKLILIKENGYLAPPEPFQLVQEMIHNIGSVDAELRDDLIYETLSQWIPGKVLTTNELLQLLSVILDSDHLLYKLGESDTDSVFTRSFSMLVIPLLNILDLVYDKMIITERIYSDGEDERLVRPVISVLNRKILSQTFFEQWIQRFSEVEKSPEFLPAFRQKNNIKNFLKSFYFRVKFYKADADLCPAIEETLYKIEKVYYS